MLAVAHPWASDSPISFAVSRDLGFFPAQHWAPPRNSFPRDLCCVSAAVPAVAGSFDRARQRVAKGSARKAPAERSGVGPEFEKGDGRLRPSLQQRLPGAEGPPEGCSTAPRHAACTWSTWRRENESASRGRSCMRPDARWGGAGRTTGIGFLHSPSLQLRAPLQPTRARSRGTQGSAPRDPGTSRGSRRRGNSVH